MQGVAPKEIAPNLYVTAHYKKRSVSTELHNQNWIRNLAPINNPTLLQEYVTLHNLLSTVTLTEQNDQITWRWTPNGRYTVASAYRCQFFGKMTYIPAAKIWKAHVEPKCQFFAWLILHYRALTADNMIKRNWPCNATCALCYCFNETADHLLTKCNFVEPLWNKVADFLRLPGITVFEMLMGPFSGFSNSCNKVQRLNSDGAWVSCSLPGGMSGRRGTGVFLTEMKNQYKEYSS